MTHEKHDYGAVSLFTPEETELLRVKPGEVVAPDDDYVHEVLPYDGKKLDITVNKDHAYEVLDTLLSAYAAGAPPYNMDRVRLPHDPRHMPETLERGGRDHATFLFNVCYYMRGGIKSNDAVKRMARVYDDHPELFNCEVAQEFNQETLAKILGNHGLGFQKAVAKQWVENARRLYEQYDGDPRNIFADVSTYEESQEKVQNDGKGGGFLGFQEKMTSMIIYYLMDEELIAPFNFPIPVDLHVMRVSIANEMITFGDAPYGTNLFREETLRALRTLYLNYAADRDISPLRLCDAVWMLSESLCGRHPGNTTLKPEGRKARKGRATRLIPGPVDIHNPTQQKAYHDSCGICPIQETCQYNLPGTHYYVGGNLIIRGRRVRFPLPVRLPPPEQPTLF